MTDEDCAACEFNRPGKTCLRTMEWVWRGETFSASASEYYSIKNQLQARCHEGTNRVKPWTSCVRTGKCLSTCKKRMELMTEAAWQQK